MRKRNLWVGIIATGLLMTACNGSSQQKEATPSTESQEVDIYGQYEGILPAADCEGIKTKLVINKDQTYYLRSEYIGEENGIFETNGVFNCPDSTLIELITPSSGEKTYYKIIPEGVMLSDSLGTINEGELAEHYILKK